MLSAILACLAAVVAIGALGYAHKCASLAARGAPKQLLDGFTDLSSRVQAVESESANVRANMVSWIADITGLMESVEGCLGQIESKRRKTASAAARIDRDNGAGKELDPANMGRAELMQLARERGVFGDG